MPEYVGDRFHERQVVVAVSRERMEPTWALVNRLLSLRHHVVAISLAEHEWDRLTWSNDPTADDVAKFLQRVAWGPVARIVWHELEPIDRATFLDRWLRNIACGMAYGPLRGPLPAAQREALDPRHLQIANEVLALFSPECEIRHSHHEDDADGSASWSSATRATYDTCFVLRDTNMTGVFVFGEED